MLTVCHYFIAEYTTGAAKPNVTVSNIGGGGGKVGDLTITWDLLPRELHNGPNLGYKVQWKKSYMIDEEWENGYIMDADLRARDEGGRYVTLVGSSNFYRPYDVRVLAFNDMGDGPPPRDNSYVEIMSAENSEWIYSLLCSSLENKDICRDSVNLCLWNCAEYCVDVSFSPKRYANQCASSLLQLHGYYS
jgi:hypothetical protein